jgi:hypothetical protein
VRAQREPRAARRPLLAHLNLPTSPSGSCAENQLYSLDCCDADMLAGRLGGVGCGSSSAAASASSTARGAGVARQSRPSCGQPRHLAATLLLLCTAFRAAWIEERGPTVNLEL